MTTRREFLQASIAASAVPMAVGAFSSDRQRLDSPAPAGSAPAPNLYRAVFDERFSDSVAFAVEMRRLGVAVHGIAGDMTDLWYRELYPQWQQAPVPIAGLTAHGPLFCLERLAWDHGMRVVFRAEHQFRSDGCVEHVVSASDAVLLAAAGLEGAGSNWSAYVAGLVARCSPGRLEQSPVIVTQRAGSPRVQEEPLFSWVIAPVARA